MNLRRPEQQMIEVIRENASNEFRLLIEREGGAWEITMSVAPHDDRHKARGTGGTFDEAWNNMAPLWA